MLISTNIGDKTRVITSHPLLAEHPKLIPQVLKLRLSVQFAYSRIHVLLSGTQVSFAV